MTRAAAIEMTEIGDPNIDESIPRFGDFRCAGI
jgi:hypothetical protein